MRPDPLASPSYCRYSHTLTHLPPHNDTRSQTWMLQTTFHVPVLAYDVSEFVPGSAKGRDFLHSNPPSQTLKSRSMSASDQH